MKLSDKVAVVTGAGPGYGIGRGIATAFAKEGANLFLNYYGSYQKEMDSIKKELEGYGVKVFIAEGDISKEATAKSLIERTIEEFGKVDVLVNNAGISTPTLLRNMSSQTWDRMIDVNLRSSFLTTRYAVPHMISQKFGRIINIASQVGQKGSVEHSHYAAAKAGMIGFTKSIAMELGEFGITANCIAPGPIETQLMGEVNDNWKKKKMSELVLPHFGKVEQVSPTAVFLASSPDGDLYTGQTLGPNLGDVML